ncbi:hypothetical protein QA639_09110 [Bradyrhizobium pachyrhizi]|uniref:hypothetical protein n=1 Tax=Bradyrhizobium TaxID=374 RepID=UPI0024B0E62B|nr:MULTISPECIES: hypothetical protein [Bradyrhizobium]WFU57655.1 hypothetical protein QA639_09110 [Bradyrhizobium pachyrhizi]WOH83201.1 hypothetical protein RX327_08680 [Bradyrhizobium sp. BEA-2-5]
MAFAALDKAVAETNFDIQLLEARSQSRSNWSRKICEKKSAVEAERELERLERQLVEESMRSVGRAKALLGWFTLDRRDRL